MRKRLTDAQISDLTRVMNGFSCIGDSIYFCQGEEGVQAQCTDYAAWYITSLTGYTENVAFINSLNSVIKNIDSYKITHDWSDFVQKFELFLPYLTLYIQIPTVLLGATPGGIDYWLVQMEPVSQVLNALQNAYYKALSTTFASPQVPMGKIDDSCKPYLGLPLYQDLIDTDLRIGVFMTLYEWAETLSGLSPGWQRVAYAMPFMYSASISDVGGAVAMKEIKDKAFDCFSYMGEDWNSFESFMLSLSSTWNEYVTSGATESFTQPDLTEWLVQMNPIYCEFSCYQQSMVKAVMEIAPPSSGDQKK